MTLTHQIAAFLFLALMAGTAGAVCPAHNPTFTSSSGNSFRICPPEVDNAGDPVDAQFYASCTVTVTYGNNKTLSTTVTSLTPGTPVLVTFPAAKGASRGYGFCTNLDGLIGDTAMSDIRFPRGAPAGPPMGP